MFVSETHKNTGMCFYFGYIFMYVVTKQNMDVMLNARLLPLELGRGHKRPFAGEYKNG